MKTKRIISIIVCIAMLASCVFALNFSANAATQSIAKTGESAYQDMLKKTSASNYGLANTVNEGTILQAWNWSYNNITANLATIAEQGFTTIQVSPPNEIKLPTKGVNVIEADNSNGWWMFYQPAGFQLNESTDNALGVKSEFVKMCTEAHKLGLKVIVDAVINHMGTDDDHLGTYNNTSTNPMDHVNPRAKLFEPEIIAAKAFHSPWRDCEYHENFWDGYDVNEITRSLTRDCTSGLPDLDTSTAVVQTAIYDYMKELIESGADGFRIDAAKHIETSQDVPLYRSNFWENTLLKIRSDFPDNEVFAYGEILNKCGDGRPFSMYTCMMDVTDSGSYWGIKDAATKNGGGNAIPSYPNDNFTKQNVMLWDESHDTYIDGSTTYLTTEQRNRIWALVAGRAEITSVYLARPDDATTTNPCKSIKIGELRKTSWSNPTTKAINQFHNYFSTTEAEYCNQSGSRVWIERGDSGCMIVNCSGSAGSVSLVNHILKNGTYIDAISGNKFSVNSGKITGSLGAGGIAAIYYDNDEVPVLPTTPDDTGEIPTKSGCNTIVFTDNMGWNGPNIYFWNKSTDSGPNAWPGVSMSYFRINDYGEKQYIYFVPVEYDMVIINNGTLQTTDTPITGHMGIYVDTKVDDTHFNAGLFDVSTPKPTQPPVTQQPVTQPPVTQATTSTEPVYTYQYKVGDANDDGSIDITDATVIQRHLAKLAIIMDEKVLKAADTNEDGKLTIVDATCVQLTLAHLESPSKCGETRTFTSTTPPAP